MTNIPSDCRYTEDHEWARLEDNGAVRIGITDYAQDSLGEIVYVELPAPGDEVSAGDAFGTVESTKSVSDLVAPISGEVIEVNGDIDGNPGMVNAEPYGEGWLVLLRPADTNELEDLMDAEKYEAHVGETT